MYQSERLLIKVATKEGHAAFWLHELAHLADGEGGCRISLLPYGNAQYRYLDSAWPTERVLRAIEELTGPPNTIIKKVAQDPNGTWRDLNTGVKVDI